MDRRRDRRHAPGSARPAPGTLPTIPGGNGGADVTPKGSVFISATFAGGARIQLDCQPGTAPTDGTSFTPAPAGAVRVGADRRPARRRRPRRRSKTPGARAADDEAQALTAKRVSLALACADAACKGAVTLKYAGGVGRAQEDATRSQRARSKTLKLTLSAKAAQKSLKRRSRCSSPSKVTADGGKTVTKKLRLK